MKKIYEKGIFLVFFTVLVIIGMRLIVDYGDLKLLIKYKKIITLVFLAIFAIEGWTLGQGLKKGLTLGIIGSILGSVLGIWGLYAYYLTDTANDLIISVLSPWELPFLGIIEYFNFDFSATINSIFSHFLTIIILLIITSFFSFLSQLFKKN